MSRVDFSDPATIAILVEALKSAGVAGMEIERPGQTVRIVVDTASSDNAVRVTNAAAAAVKSAAITAPMAGIFEPWSRDQTPSYAGDPHGLTAGDILGFIRVGIVLVPVAATVKGRLVRCVAEHGAIVGYGDPLFDIEIPA